MTAALILGALALYLGTATSHLAGGDSAEFVTIFARGGVAHPSGYPLYCIALRLLSWMPGGAVLGASRVSAVVGALAVGALFRACRAWEASPGASLVAAASFGVTPVAWRLATEAEVFGLNALLAALLLCAAAPKAAWPASRAVTVLAGLAGLALSNHLTIVALAPVGLLATARRLRGAPARQRVPIAVSALAALCAGLLPYLYCYEVARDPQGRYVWGEPGTWSALVRHVTRADFGIGQLSASGLSASPFSNVWRFVTDTADQTLVVLLVVGLLGFATTIAHARSTEESWWQGDRGSIVALVSTWALAGPVLGALLDLPGDALGAAPLLERFQLLPLAVLAIGIAWGLDSWPGLKAGRAGALGLAATAVAAAAVLHVSRRVQAAHTDALDRYTTNTEKCAPERAVILGTGDYRLFSFLYLATAGARPDVTYVDPHLLRFGWYRARIGEALGGALPAASETTDDAIAVVDRALAAGRPVLLTNTFDPELSRAFPSYPLGTLIRLLPRGATLPPPETVEAQNVAVFDSFEPWTRGGAQNDWARAVLPSYRRPWIALARAYANRGDEVRAKDNRERADRWGDPSE